MSPLAVAIIAADAVVDQAPQATNHDPDQIVPLVDDPDQNAAALLDAGQLYAPVDSSRSRKEVAVCSPLPRTHSRRI